MEIITGYTGENHVTSADDASLYRGIFGQGDYVLDVGNKFAATIIDNNTVRIMDGDLVIQGHQARIRANDYEEVTIDNGTPGEKRNDLIVARYQKNTTTGIESITLEVVKGTPGETATDPDIIQEDLSTGGTQRDFVLYRVSLNGLVLENITSLFTVLPNLKDFMTHQAENASKHITESGENVNGRYIKFDDGTIICYMTKPINYQTEFQAISFVYPAAIRSYGNRRQANKNVSFSVSSTLAYEGPGAEVIVDNPHITGFSATPREDGTGCTVRVAYDRGTATTREVDLMVTVIGRWK